MPELTPRLSRKCGPVAFLKPKLPLLALLLATLSLLAVPAFAGPGYALSFNPNNNYVRAEIPALTNNYTLSAWVFLRSGGDYPWCRVGLLTDAGGSNSVELLIRSQTPSATDPQYLELGRAGALDGWTSSRTVPLNQWVHIAVTLDANKKYTFYINGAAAGVGGYSADEDATLGPAIHLASQNAQRRFDGLLDEVQIWSVARSQAEIQAGMNQVPDVTDPNLVAYWPFEEGAGSDTTADASGHGHSGTLVNAPAWQPAGVLLAPEGAALAPADGLAFDGVDDYVETGTAVIPGSGDFTVECWAYCPVAPNSYREILSQGSPGNAFYIGTDLANNIRLGDGWGTVSPAVPFPIGGWHHLAVVKTSTNSLFYLDGTNRLVRGSAMANPAATTGLRLGRQYGSNGEYWPGSLAEVRIWNRPLSAAEIQASQTLRPMGTETNLVAWWQFNEGGGHRCQGLKGSVDGLQTNVVGTLLNGAARVATYGTALNGPEAGSVSVALPGGAWTATTTASWLSLPAANGLAGADVVISYGANPGPTRQGTVALGGRFIRVTQAGTGYVRGSEISTLVSTGLAIPSSVAVDPAGNVYIGNVGNSTITKWDAVSNTMTVITSGDYVATDGAGDVYFSDTGGGAIRKWNPASNTPTTLVSSGLLNPKGLAVDTAGNVYIAEYIGNTIRKWNAASSNLTTVVGSSILKYPEDVAVDAAGNVFFPGYNNTIRKWNQAQNATAILLNTGSTASALAVDSTERIHFAAPDDNCGYYACGGVEEMFIGGLSQPRGVAVDRAGNLYIADTGNLAIKIFRRVFVDTTTKFVGAAAGHDALASVLPANTRLDGTSAPVSHQPWLTITGVTNGVVSFSFAANSSRYSRIGNLTVFGKDITVLQAAAVALPAVTLGTTQLVEGPEAGTASVVLGAASNSTPWTATPNDSWLHLPTPNGVGSTNLIFTYDANPGITRAGTLTIAGQTLTVTQAGAPYVSAPNSPTPLNSSGLAWFSSLAVDPAGNVFVVEYESGMIKRWTAASNTFATVGSSASYLPEVLAVDDLGDVFVAGCFSQITKWDAANNTLAALSSMTPTASAPGGIGLDAAGNAYISQLYNGSLRQWNAASNTATTLIPSGLNSPKSVAVDVAGNLYIAESANHAIKKWDAASHTLSTLISGLNYPAGVAVDGSGNVYIANESSLGVMRWNAADNTLTTLANPGSYSSLGSVALDKAGNVFFLDRHNQAIYELPRAFVDPTARFVGPAAGTGTLPAVLPVTANLRDPFAPTSDQPWLTITGVTNGVVSFAYTAYSGTTNRTANIALLTRIISITQTAALRVDGWSLTDSHQFQFQLTGMSAATYTVLTATNLAQPLDLWLPTGQILETSPGHYVFTDTNAAAGPSRFYRLRAP